MGRRHGKWWARTGAVVASLLASCLSLAFIVGAPSAGASSSGGTATFAELPGEPLNYIFPDMPAEYANNSNIGDFQFLLYRPLYWFGAKTPTLNSSLSLAKAPTYSDHDLKVTVTLKPYKWSNGDEVTNRDIEFWVNLVKYNPTDFFSTVPGEFPYNIKSMALSGTRTITFTLTKAYSKTWFLHNELSLITPLPSKVWDKTSATGSVGNYDMTSSGAQAVYKFLAGQSAQLSTYATNPLWKVVDGPFKLSAFTVEGEATFVPNKLYSGPVKAKISKLVELPFTTDSAEYAAVRAGDVDYGYVPPADAKIPVPGYTISPWNVWAIAVLYMNFNNPTLGAAFSQQYVRAAMAHLVDQTGFIKTIFHGFATADYGPVPQKPKTSDLTSYEASNPYPYSVSAAKKLLKSHGWDVKPRGVDTCVKPGTKSDECGAGVKKGTALKINFLYGTGNAAETSEVQFMKSDFSQAGIDLNLVSTAGPNFFNEAQPCTPSQSVCKWQMADSGTLGWFYGNDSYPTGDQMFTTGASFNIGSFSNSHLNQVIAATTTSNSIDALHTYENLTAKTLPVLFQPVSPGQISAIKDNLKGTQPQSIIQNINPENWYFAK